MKGKSRSPSSHKVEIKCIIIEIKGYLCNDLIRRPEVFAISWSEKNKRQ